MRKLHRLWSFRQGTSDFHHEAGAFLSPTALHLGKLCFNGWLLAATQWSAPTLWAHPFDTQPHLFSVDQTSLFSTESLPTRSCSSKVSIALARSWKSLSSFESIPGMLCIACLGREWPSKPCKSYTATPNRSSFFELDVSGLFDKTLIGAVFVSESLPLWWSKLQLHASFFQPAILL